MAQSYDSPRERTATASVDLARIQPGWTVYDALDRPCGNATDVDDGQLRIDGRPEGFGIYRVPVDSIRRVEDGSVYLSIDSTRMHGTTDGTMATPQRTTREADAAVEDTAPISRTVVTPRKDRAMGDQTGTGSAQNEHHDGSSFTASGVPVGQGSNTPVGQEPSGFRAWDEGVEQGSGWSKVGWLAGPVGIGAAGAAAYVWWRNRQRRSRLERLTRGLMAAGGTVAPVLDAARERKMAWWLASLAAVPLAYYLRTAGRDEEEATPADEGSSFNWRERLPSASVGLSTLADALPEDVDTPPLWTAIVPVALAGLVGAWFAARRRHSTPTRSERRLREIMTRNVEVVRPDATVFEASTRMQRLGVGFLPVCDGRRLQGTLTDRDVVLRTVAESRDPQLATVREAMSTEVVYAFEDDTVERAAALMRQHQIRRLPIVDRARNLVGVVSLGDLAVEGDDDRLSGSTLERISEPAGR